MGYLNMIRGDRLDGLKVHSKLWWSVFVQMYTFFGCPSLILSFPTVGIKLI